MVKFYVNFAIKSDLNVDLNFDFNFALKFSLVLNHPVYFVVTQFDGAAEFSLPEKLEEFFNWKLPKLSCQLLSSFFFAVFCSRSHTISHSHSFILFYFGKVRVWQRELLVAAAAVVNNSVCVCVSHCCQSYCYWGFLLSILQAFSIIQFGYHWNGREGERERESEREREREKGKWEMRKQGKEKEHDRALDIYAP